VVCVAGCDKRCERRAPRSSARMGKTARRSLRNANSRDSFFGDKSTGHSRGQQWPAAAATLHTAPHGFAGVGRKAQPDVAEDNVLAELLECNCNRKLASVEAAATSALIILTTSKCPSTHRSALLVAVGAVPHCPVQIIAHNAVGCIEQRLLVRVPAPRGSGPMCKPPSILRSTPHAPVFFQTRRPDINLHNSTRST
jgi:hypothetical protein